MSEPVYTDSIAIFDSSKRYRYRLWRTWDPSLPRVVWLMLNPSTADASKLDPTLRRCLGYAQAWGCGSFEVVNIFALRSTDPGALYAEPDPVGPLNDSAILTAAHGATFGVVAGWGVHGEFGGRGVAVAELVTRAGYDLLCLGRTIAGHPRHPLYMARDARPAIFLGRASV